MDKCARKPRTRSARTRKEPLGKIELCIPNGKCTWMPKWKNVSVERKSVLYKLLRHYPRIKMRGSKTPIELHYLAHRSMFSFGNKSIDELFPLLRALRNECGLGYDWSVELYTSVDDSKYTYKFKFA